MDEVPHIRIVRDHVPTRDSSIIHDIDHQKTSVGGYLATRLVEAGVKCYFTIPGDYILQLLDELLKQRHLSMINCCNELNAGYAADGYARASGNIGVVVVTYMVGSLSLINAVAGAYSDDLPLLVVSGGPNSHDQSDRLLIHHTIGEKEIYQASACFTPVVYKTFCIRHIKDAPELIDNAILTCLQKRKPVYLEIACNLVPLQISLPSTRALDSNSINSISDPVSLADAVTDIKYCLHKSTKPVLVAGVKLRPKGVTLFQSFAELVGCGVAVLPDAKSLFPEQHPQYIGYYWGSVSSHYCSEIVESSDLYIYVGALLNDYNTTGWISLLNHDKLICINPDCCTIGNKRYSNVYLTDLLANLIKEDIPQRKNSITYFQNYSYGIGPGILLPRSQGSLSLMEFKQQLQSMISPRTELIVETGDAWFIGQEMKLPTGANYHVQMQVIEYLRTLHTRDI